MKDILQMIDDNRVMGHGAMSMQYTCRALAIARMEYETQRAIYWQGVKHS